MENVIINKKDIDIFASLECGQTFRFEKINNDTYEVYSLDKKAVIKDLGECYSLSSKDIQYFEKYFALDEDYDQIFNALMKMPYIKNLLNKDTKRLRILKQDAFEMIISFIVSANNNIPRIKKIIKRMCTLAGSKIEDYYAFPTKEQLNEKPLEFFKEIGLGYRAEYIKQTVKDICDKKIDIDSLYLLPTEKAKKELLSLKGIGPKVCDCILLFGYNKFDVFPVDTWIQKVYVDIFKKEENINKMRQDFLNMFSPYAGIAQQYLFFAKRSNN